MFSLFISLNICTIYILSSVYVQYIYRIIVHSFFQVSKVRTSGKNNADQRGRKTEGVVISQPSDLTSKLFVLLLHVQYKCISHWIVKNDCSNCTTKQDTTKVYQIPDGLFPGQQVMLRGRVPWGSKSWVTCIKEIQGRMCMLVSVGAGRRKWYMTSSKLFHVSYFFSPDAW